MNLGDDGAGDLDMLRKVQAREWGAAHEVEALLSLMAEARRVLMVPAKGRKAKNVREARARNLCAAACSTEEEYVCALRRAGLTPKPIRVCLAAVRRLAEGVDVREMSERIDVVTPAVRTRDVIIEQARAVRRVWAEPPTVGAPVRIIRVHVTRIRKAVRP